MSISSDPEQNRKKIYEKMAKFSQKAAQISLVLTLAFAGAEAASIGIGSSQASSSAELNPDLLHDLDSPERAFAFLADLEKNPAKIPQFLHDVQTGKYQGVTVGSDGFSLAGYIFPQNDNELQTFNFTVYRNSDKPSIGITTGNKNRPGTWSYHKSEEIKVAGKKIGEISSQLKPEATALTFSLVDRPKILPVGEMRRILAKVGLPEEIIFENNSIHIDPNKPISVTKSWAIAKHIDTTQLDVSPGSGMLRFGNTMLNHPERLADLTKAEIGGEINNITVQSYLVNFYGIDSAGKSTQMWIQIIAANSPDVNNNSRSYFTQVNNLTTFTYRDSGNKVGKVLFETLDWRNSHK